MNPLLNIIYLAVALFYLMPRIDKYATEPITNKLLFVVVALGLQVIFDLIVKLIKRKGNPFKNFSQTIDRSLMKSLLLLLGVLLYNDAKESPAIVEKIPGLKTLLSLPSSKIIFVLIPLFVITTGKCFLKPY